MPREREPAGQPAALVTGPAEEGEGRRHPVIVTATDSPKSEWMAPNREMRPARRQELESSAENTPHVGLQWSTEIRSG